MRPGVLLLLMLSTLVGLASAGEPAVSFRLGSYEPTELAVERFVDPMSDRPLYLEAAILLSEADIDSAFAREDPVEGGGVDMVLTEGGARKLEEITRANLHRTLAILLEGEILVAPRIQAPIPGGRVTISHFPDPLTRNRFLNVLEERGVVLGPEHVMPPPPSEAELDRMIEARQRELIGLADEGRGHYVPEDTLLAAALVGMTNPALTGDADSPMTGTMVLRAVGIWEEQPPRDRRAWATGELRLAIETLVRVGELETAQRLTDTLLEIVFDLAWGEGHRLPPDWGFESLGRAYRKAGRYDEAERLYERALEFEPRGAMWQSFDGLVRLRIEQGRWDEAERLCQRELGEAGEPRSPIRHTAQRLLEEIAELREDP